jgi:hypothetical protein
MFSCVRKSISYGTAVNQMLEWGLLMGLVMGASAAEYEVDGQLEQTIYNFDYSIATFHQYNFTVFVRDCAWLIRTTQNDTNGRPVGVSETACVNGNEICEVAGSADAGNTAPGRRSPPSNMALIFSNTVPVGRTEGYFVSHIWLMFASGCYFQNQATNWLTPVYDLNASADVRPNLKREAEWDLINGPGSLPKRVVYYNYNFGRNVDAIYTATGVTNAGAVQLPSGFVFEWKSGFGEHFEGYYSTNRPVIDQYAATNHLRKRTVGIVTAVRPYCSRSDLTPTAKGETVVIDLRPWQEPGSRLSPTNIFYYVTKNGVQWLPFAKAKKAYVSHVPPKPVSRGIVVTMLLLPTALFASVWFLTRKRA